METGILNVKWSAYQQHVFDSRRELFEMKYFSDVTLVSKEMKTYKADKAIIGPASGLLKKIFLTKQDPKLTILLKDIMEIELAAVLQFVYLGETIIEESRIDDFRKATQILQIVGMEQEPPTNIKDNTENIQQDNLMNADLDQESKNLMTFLSSDTKDEFSLNSKILEPDPVYHSNVQNINHTMNSTTDTLVKKVNKLDMQPIIKKENKGRSNKKRLKDCFSKLREPQQREDKDIFETKLGADGCSVRFYKGVNVEMQKNCPDCDSNFTNTASLRDHIRYKHIGIKFDCHLCDYRATKKFSLKFHIQTMHFGIKFPCNYCPYKSSKKPRLEHHILKKHRAILTESEQKSLNGKDLGLKEAQARERRRERIRKVIMNPPDLRSFDITNISNI